MASDLDEQRFGMREAALYSGFYPKLLRTQLERGTYTCGVRHPPPVSRWTFSIADVLFLRLLNDLTGVPPGFEPSRMVNAARALTQDARDVWEGREPDDLKVALGWESTVDLMEHVKVRGNFSAAWINGSDRWPRMQIVVPVGRAVADVREAMNEKPHVVTMPPNPFGSSRAAREE